VGTGPGQRPVHRRHRRRQRDRRRCGIRPAPDQGGLDGIGKRDEHLQSADFFDTEHFPEITVEVSGVGADGDLNATLSVRGITLPIPLTATVTPLGDGTVQVTARTTVDRTKWGISGNTMGMIPASTTLIAEAAFSKT
jgi:polyisoprenoid-binding protein YceI